MNVCVIYFKDHHYNEVDRIFKFNTLNEGLEDFNGDDGFNFDSKKYKYPRMLAETVATKNLKETGYVIFDGRAIFNLDFDTKKLKTQDQISIFNNLKNKAIKEFRENKINKIIK